MPLAIHENARATRLTLRIEPGARSLRMSVPKGIAQEEIDLFLRRHEGWLANRISRLPPPSGLAEGGEIPIAGIPHRIRRTGKPRDITEIAHMNGEAVILVGGAPEHLGRRLAEYLKKRARGELEAAVARHAAEIGKPVAGIKVRDTKSRWGSCTSKGRLSFSWRIAMAPEFVMDYLAAHEVAHLAEMNHGPRFWALCKALCPDTDRAKTWLKRNGSSLHAFDFTG